MNHLSASIVLYKTDKTMLDRIIDCFMKVELDKKLFIINNFAKQTTEDRFQNKNIEYIQNNRNIGFGAAHNLAIRKSLDNFKYHLVLNPDIFFKKGTIEIIFDFMEKNSEVGHLMPKVLYPNGKIQYLCKLLPKPFDLVRRRLFPDFGFFKKQNDRFELRFTNYDMIMNIPYLSGCFMFLRTNVLKKVGLFDERFFMYPEDIDLTRRIHKNFRTVFFPEVSIYHDHARESYKTKKLLLIHITNMIKYFNKWGWFFDKERKEINRKTLERLSSPG